MNALILEDDLDIAKMIQLLLVRGFSNYFKTIDVAHSVQEAIHFISQKTYDLFLFDINLGSETSFEVLSWNKNSATKLIFITGHEKYAIQAIKSGAIDYILKPINTQEFKVAIEKAIQLIQNENLEQPKLDIEQLSKKQLQSLQISDSNTIHFVKLQDIVYLASQGPYTTIYLEQQTSIISSKNLKQFEEKLAESGFFRVHHSYIINSLKIKNINKSDGFTVTMLNSVVIDISSRKKDSFLSYISKIIDI